MNEDELWNLMDKVSIKENNYPKEISCSYCHYDKFIKDDNLLTCVRCHNIIDNIIDCSAEWRYYNGDDNKSEDPSRCGLPTNVLLPKSSLGSIIGKSMRDSKDLHCIRKLQTWTSMPYSERKLLNVFERFTNNTNNKGISGKVLYDAKIMYKKVSSLKISRGDNNDGLVASCVYYACIINNVPRSIKEIAEMFEITPITLTKGNARFQKLNPMNVFSSSPHEFISRFGSQLNMSQKDIAVCVELSKYLYDEDILRDNSPTSSASGIICYYCNNKGLDISKKYIANICGVSEVTVTKSFKHILKYDNVIKEHYFLTEKV